MAPTATAAEALVASNARLHALTWLVKHQQALCDDLQHRLSPNTATPPPLPPPPLQITTRKASVEAHLQSALHSLAACSLALADRAVPDRDEAHEIRALARRIADALDACTTLAQAAPVAHAAAETAPPRQNAMQQRLEDAQACVERLSTENAGLRAAARTLREHAKRAADEAADCLDAAASRERQLRVQVGIAKQHARKSAARVTAQHPPPATQQHHHHTPPSQQQHHHHHLPTPEPPHPTHPSSHLAPRGLPPPPPAAMAQRTPPAPIPPPQLTPAGPLTTADDARDSAWSPRADGWGGRLQVTDGVEECNGLSLAFQEGYSPGVLGFVGRGGAALEEPPPEAAARILHRGNLWPPAG